MSTHIYIDNSKGIFRSIPMASIILDIDELELNEGALVLDF